MTEWQRTHDYRSLNTCRYIIISENFCDHWEIVKRLLCVMCIYVLYTVRLKYIYLGLWLKINMYLNYDLNASTQMLHLHSIIHYVLSHVWLFVTHQVLGISVLGISRQEYWSGLSFLPPGDLLDPGINPCLLHLLHCR